MRSKLSLLLPLFLIAGTAAAQEMEPRAYSPAPTGAQFVLLTYGHQSGDVLLDSSLPLQDVSIKFNLTSIGYGRTFSLAAGRQTLLFSPLTCGEQRREQSLKIR